MGWFWYRGGGLAGSGKGKELLDCSADGFIRRGGSLVETEQRGLMFGGGEGDQGIVGGAAEDLPGGYRSEKFLMTGLRQGQEWLGETLGDEGLHDCRMGAVRWREPCQNGVGLNCRVRDQARTICHGLSGDGVMLVPGGEGSDYHAGIDRLHRRGGPAGAPPPCAWHPEPRRRTPQHPP